MVDICPNTLNIDPAKIERAITDKTTGILATHVFGNPCDVNAIAAIGKKHGLHIIYDAAHAFGTVYQGRSLLSYGDVATCSFHATKLFHTIEGGAVMTANATTSRRMALMRNFGHTSLTEFDGVGINGKNSEMHAAMGLCTLKYMPQILNTRKRLCALYSSQLNDLPVTFQKIALETEYNHAYYPVIFENEATLTKVMTQLNFHNIYPRRYFYPSLSSLPYVNGQRSPISEDISRRILCLPLYHTLSDEEVVMICRLVARVLKF